MTNWDERFLHLALHVSRWSKDPSTQVGAVIVRPDRTIASVGYNGFPRGVVDDHRLHTREDKYPLVVHAEMNAVLNAREPLNGYTLYLWPLPCCSRCAVHIIQAGIKRVVAAFPAPERWKMDCERAAATFKEAGVQCDVQA